MRMLCPHNGRGQLVRRTGYRCLRSGTDKRVNTCYQRSAQARARVIGEGDGAVRPAVGQQQALMFPWLSVSRCVTN